MNVCDSLDNCSGLVGFQVLWYFVILVLKLDFFPFFHYVCIELHGGSFMTDYSGVWDNFMN